MGISLCVDFLFFLTVDPVGLSIQPNQAGTGLMISCSIETATSTWEPDISIWNGKSTDYIVGKFQTIRPIKKKYHSRSCLFGTSYEPVLEMYFRKIAHALASFISEAACYS